MIINTESPILKSISDFLCYGPSKRSRGSSASTPESGQTLNDKHQMEELARISSAAAPVVPLKSQTNKQTNIIHSKDIR